MKGNKRGNCFRWCLGSLIGHICWPCCCYWSVSARLAARHPLPDIRSVNRVSNFGRSSVPPVGLAPDALLNSLWVPAPFTRMLFADRSPLSSSTGLSSRPGNDRKPAKGASKRLPRRCYGGSPTWTSNRLGKSRRILQTIRRKISNRKRRTRYKVYGIKLVIRIPSIHFPSMSSYPLSWIHHVERQVIY